MVCIPPPGEHSVGVETVGTSWRRILSGDKRCRLQLGNTRSYGDGRLVTHVLYENTSIGDNRRSPVSATNIHSFNDNGWHAVLHHASPVTGISTKDATRDPGRDTQTLH
jgi:hypothetical protein